MKKTERGLKKRIKGWLTLAKRGNNWSIGPLERQLYLTIDLACYKNLISPHKVDLFFLT